MKTIADVLAEIGRKVERKKSHLKEAALREEVQRKEAALREEVQRNEAALREEVLRNEAALREDAKKKVQEETVQRMLQKNMNIELIRDITGLTNERIKVIQKKMCL